MVRHILPTSSQKCFTIPNKITSFLDKIEKPSPIVYHPTNQFSHSKITNRKNSLTRDPLTSLLLGFILGWFFSSQELLFLVVVMSFDTAIGENTPEHTIRIKRKNTQSYITNRNRGRTQINVIRHHLPTSTKQSQKF